MKRLVSAIFLMALSPIASAICVFAGEFTGHSYLKGDNFVEKEKSFGEQVFQIDTKTESASVTPSDTFCIRIAEEVLWCEALGGGEHERMFEFWTIDMEARTVIYTKNRKSKSIDALSGGTLLKGKVLSTCG